MIDRGCVLEVIRCAKRLDDKGMVNAYSGNISLVHEDLMYITPTGKGKDNLTEEMIAVLDASGNQVSGIFRPTSETPMHRRVYKIRENIGGVIHTHAPYLTAYALCNKAVETRAYPEMMGNFGNFSVAPYGRPGTDEIIKGAVPILEKRDIVLLGNHGAISVGKTLEDALWKMEAAEAIAKTLFIAEHLGGQAALPDDECAFFFSLSDR